MLRNLAVGALLAMLAFIVLNHFYLFDFETVMMVQSTLFTVGWGSVLIIITKREGRELKALLFFVGYCVLGASMVLWLELIPIYFFGPGAPQ